jgi:hypothetical protein
VSAQPRILHVTTPQDDEASVCRRDNRVFGFYRDDLQKLRFSCQKKIEFVRFEPAIERRRCTRRRARPELGRREAGAHGRPTAPTAFLPSNPPSSVLRPPS